MVIGLPYRRLALALVNVAVVDARAGSLDARDFLASNAELEPWAEMLGLRPSALRRAAAGLDWAQQHAEARLLLSSARPVVPPDPPDPPVPVPPPSTSPVLFPVSPVIAPPSPQAATLQAS